MGPTTAGCRVLPRSLRSPKVLSILHSMYLAHALRSRQAKQRELERSTQPTTATDRSPAIPNGISRFFPTCAPSKVGAGTAASFGSAGSAGSPCATGAANAGATSASVRSAEKPLQLTYASSTPASADSGNGARAGVQAGAASSASQFQVGLTVLVRGVKSLVELNLKTGTVVGVGEPGTDTEGRVHVSCAPIRHLRYRTTHLRQPHHSHACRFHFSMPQPQMLRTCD